MKNSIITTLFLAIVSLSHSQTITNAIRQFEVEFDSSDAVTNMSFKMLIKHYKSFNEKFGLEINKLSNDSTVIIHKCVRRYIDRYIDRSLVLDGRTKEISILNYSDTSIHVTPLKTKFQQPTFNYFTSFKDHIECSRYLTTVRYRSLEYFLIEVPSSDGIVRIFRVCLYGLPKNNWVDETYQLKESSPWYSIRQLLSSNPRDSDSEKLDR